VTNALTFDFSFVYGRDGQSKIEWLQIRELQMLHQVRSFLASFIFYNYNAYDEKYKGSNDKTKTQNQIKFFKEITGKSNSQYCLAQISKIFGNKFLGFFSEDRFHDNFLSLESVGESSGGTTANVRDSGLNDNGVWGKRLNGSIIASKGVLSTVKNS